MQRRATAHDDAPPARCKHGTEGCFIGRHPHMPTGCDVIRPQDPAERVDREHDRALAQVRCQRDEALARVARAAQTIISMACQIHQAYHEGDPTTCPRGYCTGARNVAESLMGPDRGRV